MPWLWSSSKDSSSWAAAFCGGDLHPIPDNGVLEHLVQSRAFHRHIDLGAPGAAQPLVDLLDVRVGGIGPVDADDLVSWAQAKGLRGAALERLNNRDDAVEELERHPNAGVVTAVLLLHLAILFRRNVAGMGVEVAKHSFDGVVEEGVDIHVIDVVELDDLHHPLEGFQSGIEIPRCRDHLRTVCSGHHGEQKKGDGKADLCYVSHRFE